jgi:hypothetical protein
MSVCGISASRRLANSVLFAIFHVLAFVLCICRLVSKTYAADLAKHRLDLLIWPVYDKINSYITNLTTSAVSFTVAFFDDNGQPLTVPALSASSATVNLAARGSALIEAPNTGALVTGYVLAALPAGVAGYGVFRQSVSGEPDQEAVVPLSGTTTTTSTLLFDNTYYATGVAIVNLSSAPSSVTLQAYDNQGNVIGTGSLSLAANAHTSAALPSLPGLAGVAGVLGSVDFSVPNGSSIAVLGLRFNGAAFTSIPATNQ